MRVCLPLLLIVLLSAPFLCSSSRRIMFVWLVVVAGLGLGGLGDPCGVACGSFALFPNYVGNFRTLSMKPFSFFFFLVPFALLSPLYRDFIS